MFDMLRYPPDEDIADTTWLVTSIRYSTGACPASRIHLSGSVNGAGLPLLLLHLSSLFGDEDGDDDDEEEDE